MNHYDEIDNDEIAANRAMIEEERKAEARDAAILTTDDYTALLDALTDDLGSTYGAPNVVKVSDTALWRAELRPDDIYSEDIGDWGDCYGRTAWTRSNDYGRVRPDGFDGNAEVLRTDHGDALWWQPPTDVPRSDADTFREVRANVRDILEFGFYVVSVEYCEGTDAYGRPIVVSVEGLGGIEPFADEGYLREVVGDCVREIVAARAPESNK